MDDLALRCHSCFELDGVYFKCDKVNFDEQINFFAFDLEIPGTFYTECRTHKNTQ